jgi:hypothetical protein
LQDRDGCRFGGGVTNWTTADITVSIKTFLRDEKCFKAVRGIQRIMPEAKISVADDGLITSEKTEFYAQLRNQGHQVFILDFDAGFSAKSNIIVDNLKTPLLLQGSDDFEFDSFDVWQGIEKMLQVIQNHRNFDVVCGRVDNQPYEYLLLEVDNEVYEIPLGLIDLNSDCCGIELGKNYWLAKRRVFDSGIRWDSGVRIGNGEHASLFLDIKHAGFKVGYAYGANINAQPDIDSPEYNRYRRRACSPERSCFEKRGIKKYILASGQVDWEKK